MIQSLTILAALAASPLGASAVTLLPEQMAEQIAATMYRTPADDVARDLVLLPNVVTVDRESLRFGTRIIDQNWRLNLSVGRRMTLERIVPYRYPRPSMERMRDLVVHAAKHGARRKLDCGMDC